MSDLPPPRQPYRAAAFFHAVLALIILAFAGFSGGSLTRAFAIAGAYFVAATAWSWFRFRQKEARPPRANDVGGDAGDARRGADGGRDTD